MTFSSDRSWNIAYTNYVVYWCSHSQIDPSEARISLQFTVKSERKNGYEIFIDAQQHLTHLQHKDLSVLLQFCYSVAKTMCSIDQLITGFCFLQNDLINM